jgi:hypothetical protein
MGESCMKECSRCGCVAEMTTEFPYPGQVTGMGHPSPVPYPGQELASVARLCASCLSFVRAAIEGRPVFSRGEWPAKKGKAV